MTSVWAHRGSSAYAPENTLPAFELALEQGADGFELDVQLTRDDEVVVFHDETLERTTDGRGWVADHSLADLQRLDASHGRDGFAGARIPTLNQVFGLVKDIDTVINVELKNSEMPYQGLEERVLAIIDEFDMAPRIILSSFNHYSLRHLVRLGTQLPLGVLYSEPLWKPWRYASRLGATALHPPLASTRRKIVERSQENDVAVHVWTVNEPDDVQRMASWEVDAIITDRPDVARSVIG